MVNKQNPAIGESFKIEQPFDPLEAQKLKIFPVDWVNEQKGVSDGPKRVYCYLYGIAVKSDRGKNSWPGYVYPSVGEVALRLGKPASCIRRDIATLKKVGLLRIERPNQRDYNRYYFLWQTAFDSRNVSAHKNTDESRDMGAHNAEEIPASAEDERRNLSDVSAEICTHERRNVSAPYKEDSQVIPESYSREQNTDDSRASSKPRSKSPELPASRLPAKDGWTGLTPIRDVAVEDVQQLRAEMQAIRGLPPTHTAVVNVRAALGESALGGFVKHLRGVGPRYRQGGHRAVSTWKWFESTAKSYAEAEAQAQPAADGCRHGLADGACLQCLPRVQFDAEPPF